MHIDRHHPLSLLAAAGVAVALAEAVDAQSLFVPAREPAVFSRFESPILTADFDGDGDLDLWAGNRVLLREDQPDGLRFRDASATSLPAGIAVPLAIDAGDLDGDGDVDLVLAVDGGNRVFSNNGQAMFVRLPSALEAVDRFTHAVMLVDVDADGDLDVFTANDRRDRSVPGVQNSLFLNDGSGIFVDVSVTQLPQVEDRSTAVAAGDVDGDGDIDLFVGDFGTPARQDRILLNDGHGRFSETTAPRLPARLASTRFAALADLDGDGDLDSVAYQASASALLQIGFNDGAGHFAQTVRTVNATLALSLSIGDADGDGDVDLLAGAVLVNDGQGGLTADPSAPDTTGWETSTTTASPTLSGAAIRCSVAKPSSHRSHGRARASVVHRPLWTSTAMATSSCSASIRLR